MNAHRLSSLHSQFHAQYASTASEECHSEKRFQSVESAVHANASISAEWRSPAQSKDANCGKTCNDIDANDSAYSEMEGNEANVMSDFDYFPMRHFPRKRQSIIQSSAVRIIRE